MATNNESTDNKRHQKLHNNGPIKARSEFRKALKGTL